MSDYLPLHFNRKVNAPAGEAFRAFTHATALRDWLSSAAYTQPAEKGYLFLQWPDRTVVEGTYSRFEPGKALAFSWHALGASAPDQVEVTFTEKEGATEVHLTHSMYCPGGKCEQGQEVMAQSWGSALENLQSFLETGIDLRQARRPRMGIMILPFTTEDASTLGIPVSEGVHIGGTMDGSGAQKAGLIKDDVLVSLDGKPTPTYDALGGVLTSHKAGDILKAEFYRGEVKHTADLELGKFPIPEIPGAAAALAAAVRQTSSAVLKGMTELTTGLSEEVVSFKPAEKEWSVKELVGHFILCERDFQTWVANMLNDQPVIDDLAMSPNVDARIHALVSRLGSLQALLKELKQSFEESAILIEGFPETFVRFRKHLYRRAADWELNLVSTHFSQEHEEQLRQTIAAAQKKG